MNIPSLRFLNQLPLKPGFSDNSLFGLIWFGRNGNMSQDMTKSSVLKYRGIGNIYMHVYRARLHIPAKMPLELQILTASCEFKNRKSIVRYLVTIRFLFLGIGYHNIDIMAQHGDCNHVILIKCIRLGPSHIWSTRIQAVHVTRRKDVIFRIVSLIWYSMHSYHKCLFCSCVAHSTQINVPYNKMDAVVYKFI